VTKPGNSGSEEPIKADTAEAPEENKAADTEAAEEVVETPAAKAAEPEPDTTEPEPTPVVEEKPKARRTKLEKPLVADLEKAPPPPKEEALRAQAKRRFEEPTPRPLRFSFYFFTASGLVWLLSSVIYLLNKQNIVDAQVKSDTTKLTPEQIDSAVNQLLWILLVASLLFTVFLGLFGYKATEGTRRARTLVTIFAVMTVIFHVFLFPAQLGLLSALFAFVGLGLLWFAPSSRKYFPPRQVP
jgi:hypothetical protein